MPNLLEMAEVYSGSQFVKEASCSLTNALLSLQLHKQIWSYHTFWQTISGISPSFKFIIVSWGGCGVELSENKKVALSACGSLLVHHNVNSVRHFIRQLMMCALNVWCSMQSMQYAVSTKWHLWAALVACHSASAPFVCWNWVCGRGKADMAGFRVVRVAGGR